MPHELWKRAASMGVQWATTVVGDQPPSKAVGCTHSASGGGAARAPAAQQACHPGDGNGKQTLLTTGQPR